MRGWPQSLYGRTAATLGIAFLAFQAIALAVVFFVILSPLAQRSADDLAALIVLSAQTWAELPPETRPMYERELVLHHQLHIRKLVQLSDEQEVHFINSRNIEKALSVRTGQSIRLEQGADGWVWVNLHMGGHLIHIGFEEKRYYIHAILTTIGLISLAALLTWATSLMLVRRISHRLNQLSVAAAQVGQGKVPQPLPEDGATELAALAVAFNRMAAEVHDLLANRTTLLAGISHDLRTPIARMRLAVAMLPHSADSDLVRQIEHDLEQMNQLIGGFLELARGMRHEQAQRIDVSMSLHRITQDFQRGGGRVALVTHDSCMFSVAEQAMQRIVTNLIDNALRYGHIDDVDSDVEVRCEIVSGRLIIEVTDRGPGIPEDQIEAVFRPFFRMETSRNVATGGSGLGLAIARQLALVNQWHLALANRPDGGLIATLTV